MKTPRLLAETFPKIIEQMILAYFRALFAVRPITGAIHFVFLQNSLAIRTRVLVVVHVGMFRICRVIR